MTGQNHRVFGQFCDFLQAFEEHKHRAAHQIGAADRPLKQRVARKTDVFGFAIVENAASRVSGRFENGQPMVAELDDVVAGEQSGRFGQRVDGGQSEEFFCLFFVVRDEVGILAMKFDFQAEFVEDKAIAEVVVKMSVRRQ